MPTTTATTSMSFFSNSKTFLHHLFWEVTTLQTTSSSVDIIEHQIGTKTTDD
jgi:hypothetical protein